MPARAHVAPSKLPLVPHPRHRDLRLCVIDLGTNSFHAVIVRVGPSGALTPLATHKAMVLLGEGSLVRHHLTDAAMARGLDALREILALGHHWHVDAFVTGATSAIREADNGSVFIERVRREVGIEVETISGAREAYLIYKAVWQSAEPQPPALLMDVGGGSTEFVVAYDDQVPFLCSLPLGAQRLTERFVTTDPVTKDERRALKRFVRSELSPVIAAAATYGVRRLIGSSGTLRVLGEQALAALRPDGKGALYRRHLKPKQLQAAIDKLKKMSRAERLALPGLNEKRVGQIVAGGLLLDVVLDEVPVEYMTFSRQALREGLALDYAERVTECGRAGVAVNGHRG